MTPSGNSARIVLDTSAYSNLRVGHEAVIEAVASAAAVVMPVVVLGELEAGFRLGSRQKENQLALGDFIEEPFVSVMEVTRDVSQRYGGIFALLRRQGTPIPTNDIWIAASTMAVAGTLLTFDQHFEKVPDLSRIVFES